MVRSDGDACWCHVLEDFNPLLLCSSSSSHAMAATASRAKDCLPFAAASPAPGHWNFCKTEVLETSCDGAFSAADGLLSSSALMNLQREDESFYMPLYSVPPLPVGDQDCSVQLPLLPGDGVLTSLDDTLLLPLSDTDLAAFDNVEDQKSSIDQMTMIAPELHHHHPATAAVARAPPVHGTTVGQNAGDIVVHAHQKRAIAIDSCFRRGGTSGVEMPAIVSHHDERRLAGSAAVALEPPPPPSLPRRPCATRSGGSDRSSAPAGKTRLDHIGFDELRKFFYMPITRAAREMNVGLTVLKKRCRELGVARWPHRKMKSLKSLMANVQEMGNGMSPVAVQQELAALETYCALMEENPWIELTDRTKKLRQACFKESYKRRRAAAVSAMEMDDHIVYSFGHHQLPPPTSSADDDRHGQSSRFFGY